VIVAAAVPLVHHRVAYALDPYVHATADQLIHEFIAKRWSPYVYADRAVASRADAVLARVGLGGEALAGTLSHGDKRKLEIALLLAGEPSVLLLDEPMAGVSAEDVPALAEVIRGLTADGRGVLMVEHHMEVVIGLAQRIAVMHGGRLIAVDTPDAIMSNETVREAYLGEEL